MKVAYYETRQDSKQLSYINYFNPMHGLKVGVAPIEEKLVQHRLRWFGHIQRRPPEAPVHSGRLKRAENVKRGRGRPILTWEESVKRDLKDWSIDKELAMDRGAWKLAIHVPEP